MFCQGEIERDLAAGGRGRAAISPRDAPFIRVTFFFFFFFFPPPFDDENRSARFLIAEERKRMYCILGGIRLLDPKVSRMESKKILEEESTKENWKVEVVPLLIMIRILVSLKRDICFFIH